MDNNNDFLLEIALRSWDFDHMWYKDIPQRIKAKREALEWECPYCGNMHLQAAQKCWDGVNGCGAPNPLLYGSKR